MNCDQLLAQAVGVGEIFELARGEAIQLPFGAVIDKAEPVFEIFGLLLEIVGREGQRRGADSILASFWSGKV